MAKLLIAELVCGAGALQIAQLPPVAQQAVTFSTSTQSNPMNSGTNFVELTADADCHIEVGANPTATTSSAIKLTAGQSKCYGIAPGMKIAAIAA